MSDQNMAGERPNFIPEETAVDTQSTGTTGLAERDLTAQSPETVKDTKFVFPTDSSRLNPFGIDIVDPFHFPPTEKPSRISVGDRLKGLLKLPTRDAGEQLIIRSHESYLRLLEAGGTDSEEVEKAHKRFSEALVRYQNSSPDNKTSHSRKAERETTLMTESSFSSAITILHRLGYNPQSTQEIQTAFNKGNHKARERIAIESQGTAKRILIDSYPRLIDIWGDVDPDHVTKEVAISKFEQSDDTQKARIARRLYQTMETSLKARLQTGAETLRQTLIDQGEELSEADMALAKANPPEQTFEDRIIRLHYLQAEVDHALLSQFDSNLDIWVAMNGGRKDIADSTKKLFESQDESGKVKMARKLYRRIDRQSMVLVSEHLEDYRRVLKDSGKHHTEIIRSVEEKDAFLMDSSHRTRFEATTGSGF